MQKTYIPFGFAQFGYSIFSNTIPLMAIIAFGLGAGEIGVLNMCVSLFSILGIIHWSRWIDRHEERRFLGCVGFFLVAIAAGIGVFSPNFYWLILSSAILGFFFSIFGLLGSTLVAQQGPGNYKERLKTYNIVISTSTLIALASAAIFLHEFDSEFGLRLLLLAVFAAFALGLSLTIFLPARAPHKPMLSKSELVKINTGIFERLHYLPLKIIPKLKLTGIDRRIYWLCLGYGMMLFGFAAFNTVLPIFLVGKGVSGTGIFAVHLSSALACTVGYLTVSRFKAEKLLKFSTGLRIIIISGFGLLALLDSPLLVLIAAAALNGLMGFGWAGISSASVRMVMRFAGSYHTGGAMGVYHLSLSSGMAVGALVGGMVFAICSASAYPLFALIVAHGLLIAILWYRAP
ncbi:MAG: MFS transporter [Thermoplasmata archaeon]|nr:MFS transporter [Thermoplasmata archaeon]